jgi:nucleotide-binding universal stress UspA family protein
MSYEGIVRLSKKDVPRRKEGDSMDEYKNLLVPTDGSDLSRKAILKAISLAKKFGSRVTVLHVEERPLTDGGPPGVEVFQPSENELNAIFKKESDRIIEETKLIAKENKMTIYIIHTKGHAANEIIKASKDFDMILMGTHGRGGLTHLLIGSVAEKVARHACCPVMLIRDKPCESKN